ncbi:hypothetical protein [Peribacillus frigoritolerans]|nr:hypothetical protein [Peribacillus frigoritolerans]
MSLLLASVILGIITGMDIRDVADAVQTGVGNTLVMLIGALVKIQHGMMG